jgi:hypothetical protein
MKEVKNENNFNQELLIISNIVCSKYLPFFHMHACIYMSKRHISAALHVVAVAVAA